ncbi:MAG: indole-3-glycerol phosphate synthase TrpC [Succiniclasticum sp.]|jgi:indole-3-glycerol phosphate synthase
MILDTLAQEAHLRVAKRKQERSLPSLRADAEALARTGERRNRAAMTFQEALRQPGLQLICECKKASPSKGLISPEYPYLEIARSYERGGAAAISCLTEPDHFLGRDQDLVDIAAETRLPILRKDFTVDPYQIYEARLLGASAVLLIAAILTPSQLKEYRELAESLGLDALVETHDEGEVDKALSAGAVLVGVNNRNLQDFTVDFTTCLRLRDQIPPDRVCVAESGVRSVENIRALKDHKVDAVLIGETLMRSSDIAATLQSFREG